MYEYASFKEKKSGNYKIQDSNFEILPILDNIFFDKNVAKIINFYVFDTPLPKITSQAINLEDYGWSNPWEKPEYLNKKMEKAFFNLGDIKCDANVEDMIDELKDTNLYVNFPNDVYTERLCINNCENNYYLSILRHIRNSFCHGRFQIIADKGQPKIFVFEDANNNKNINARMIITETTLLSWISIIKRE